MKEVRKEEQQGLYRREFEHDNCGIGAVVNIKGKKTHETVANALRIVEHLEHRAGKDAEGETGDGVGILLQISHKFFKKVCKKEGFDIGGEREVRQENVCPVSCRHLYGNPRMWKPESVLTGGFILPVGNLNRAMIIPMWCP